MSLGSAGDDAQDAVNHLGALADVTQASETNDLIRDVKSAL